MTYVVTLEGFTPGPRFDATPWTKVRIEQGAGSGGPWTALETQNLSPVDSDPTAPLSRNVTTALATAPIGWFRLVFIDAALHEQPSGAVYSSPLPFTADGETVAELLDQVMTEFGLDVTQAQALRALNQKHRRMVARSKCFKAQLVIGQTAAGVTTYDLDPDIIELFELTVGGTAWTRRGHRVVRDLNDSRLGLCNDSPGGLYAETWSPTGTGQVWLYPAPDAGLDIVAFAAVRAPNLATTDRPLVPSEFHEDLAYGTIGALLRRTDERLADADNFEQRYENATAELAQQNAKRVRPGPSQARVAGYTA